MIEFVKFNLAIGTSIAASTASLWRGTNMVHCAKQPEKPIKLYDMEACPYCRVVREALTALHLDVDVYPCPKNGDRFRQEVQVLGGRSAVPFLVDKNTGAKLYESADIIHYLFKTYGSGTTPKRYMPVKSHYLSSIGSSLVRQFKGAKRDASSRLPEKKLVLYSFESSPYSRLVREKLCEMEIPYHLVNVGKEQSADMGFAKKAWSGKFQPKKGSKREAILADVKRIQFPYLFDPNTEQNIFETRNILKHLTRYYGAQ